MVDSLNPLKFISIFSWAQTGLFYKYFTKCTAIFISHVVGDFIERAPSIFQHVFSPLNPDTLLIGQRRIPGGGFKTPFQRAATHAVMACQFGVTEIFIV